MEIIKQIESEVLIIRELKTLLGKKVKINIEVIDDAQPNKDKSVELGTYKLGTQLDDINIRNFAYEEN